MISQIKIAFGIINDIVNEKQRIIHHGQSLNLTATFFRWRKIQRWRRRWGREQERKMRRMYFHFGRFTSYSFVYLFFFLSYVFYIPEGDWPNHFSSLFLSADTLSTVIEVPSSFRADLFLFLPNF